MTLDDMSANAIGSPSRLAVVAEPEDGISVPCLTFCTPGWLGSGLARYPGRAGDWPGVDWQPGICALEVAVEHDG